MSLARLCVLPALAALASIVHASCVPDHSDVVIGRRYAADRDCLERRTAIDVVDGADPKRECEPVCMVGTSPLIEGRAVYVTRQCPPLPPTFDLSGDDPQCAAALAALERDDICQLVGSSNPIDAGDGGDATDAGDAGEGDAAGFDASDDAGSSADAAVTEDAGDAQTPADANAGDASEDAEAGTP